MKAWQLTIGLAVLAVAAGQLPQHPDSPVLIGFVETRDEVDAHLAGVGVAEVLSGDARIDACFADARMHLGPLPRIVVVRMHLRPDGTADEATVADPASLVGTGLDHCLRNTIRSLRFPSSEGSSGVWLTYPFAR